MSGLDYFERATKIEPQNPEAMVGLGYARLRAFGYGWSPTEDSWGAQLELLTKATAISPGYAFAHYVRSQVLIFAGQLPQGIEAAQTAVVLDHNPAHGYYSMALAEVFLGRCEQSIGHVKQAFMLSPRDPIGPVWHMILGLSEGCLGRLDAAIEEINRAIDAGYRTFLSYGYLAGAQAAKGDDAAAKHALAEARRLNPKLTIKWFGEHLIQPPPFLVDWWHKAGMPEQ